MHMLVPDPPAATPEAVTMLKQLHAAAEAYAKATGRSATDDLELLGHIEDHEDDLVWNVEQTFLRLTAAGFNLNGSDTYALDHYYDTTRDHVADHLDKHELLIPACAICHERVMDTMKCPNFKTECVDCCDCPDHRNP